MSFSRRFYDRQHRTRTLSRLGFTTLRPVELSRVQRRWRAAGSPADRSRRECTNCLRQPAATDLLGSLTHGELPCRRARFSALVLGCLFATFSSAYGHDPGMGGFTGGAVGTHGGIRAGHRAHGSPGWGWRPRWHASLHLLQHLAPTQPLGPIRPTGHPAVLAARFHAVRHHSD